MKPYIFIFLSLFWISCSESSSKKENDQPANQDTEVQEMSDTTSSDITNVKTALISDSLARFNGNFFSVKYPSNFIVRGVYNPLYDEHHDYSYFGTDELTVVSENGEVSFFVYSPQWGGEPMNYLDPYKNEILFSDKLEEEANEPQNTHHWITYKDTSDAYFRSIYHQTTDNTNLVFGFQYKDEATKHLYQEAYMAFKNSLEQYAD